MQAAACGLAPDVRFNPVLLKPGSDRSSQVVLLGEAVGHDHRGELPRRCGPGSPRPPSTTLRRAARRVRRGGLRGRRQPGRDQPAGRRLRQHGAGPARRPARDRGRRHRPGRGVRLAVRHARPARRRRPGAGRRVRHQQVPRRPRPAPARAWTCCTQLTGRPTLGRAAVAPRPVARRRGLARLRPGARPARRRRAGSEWLRVAVVRLPRISNATDAEALAAEPGVRVRLTVEPAELADADLVVLPGSKSTVDDLALAAAAPAWPTRCSRHAAAGRAAARHLRRLPDARPSASTTRWRAGAARSPGSGLLPVEITFAAAEDASARPAGTGVRVGAGARVRDPPRVRVGRPTRACRR